MHRSLQPHAVALMKLLTTSTQVHLFLIFVPRHFTFSTWCQVLQHDSNNTLMIERTFINFNVMVLMYSL